MASRGINKVILVGNVGSAPEVRYNNNQAWAKFSVATSDSWRDKATGEQREKTEWHSVVVNGKLAEIAGEYLGKGSQVYIEGQLKTRKWKDQNGQDRYSTDVVVSGFNGVMQMLGGRQQGNNQQQGQPQQRQQGQPSQQQPPQQPQYSEPPMDFDDDIPFAPIGLQYPALLNCI